MQIHARHYASGRPTAVRCTGSKITGVGPVGASSADLQAGWMAPAFFDVQINGCLGHSFNSADLTVDHVRQVVAVCRGHGISSFCPTLVTNSNAAILHALGVLASATEIESLHLEGPYISPEDGPRGAHPRQHVRPPDWDEFCAYQEAAGGRIRLVTLAPEVKGALHFIEKLVESGVVAAIGHTAATPPQIDAAVRAGARLSTHLGNGSHMLLPRHDNYFWAQLADDRLWASIICDGHHLPTSILRSIVRVKTPARLILTCDASSLAGLPPGRYRHWDQAIEIQGTGRIGVEGTSFLAGSGSFTDACVGQALQTLGLSLSEVIDMATQRPREILGLPPRRLEVGYPADLILFEWDEHETFALTGTLVAGQYYPPAQ